MAIAPSIQTHDIDRFQDRQGEFIEAATPDELREAIYRCSVQIERWAEESALRPGHNLFDYVNNGTALIGSIVTELIRRLEVAQQAKADLVLLASYLAEQGTEAKDIAYAVEKPWKYADELAEAKREVQS